jgi:hypothetical protein
MVSKNRRVFRLARTAFFSLLPLGFAFTGMGSVQAASLTTAFDPTDWLLVNTNPVESIANTSNNTCGALVRVQACVDTFSSTGFTLLGSGSDLPNPGANTTSLTMYESNSTPYRITFNWTFVPQSVTTGISISISNGTIITNNYEGNNFTASTDDDTQFSNVPATVYLSQGASLTFSISSPNTSSAPFFTMTDFNATAVPAPLPIAGSSAVLLYSRRLRRRTLTAASQPPALHPSTGKVMSLAEQRASLQRQLALKHYGTILGGPVHPVLPISRSTTKS